MRLNPEHRQEHLLAHLVENLVLVRNLVLDQNLVLYHDQNRDLLLVHVPNLGHLLDHIANRGQDLVLLSPEILPNQGHDQNQLQDLILDLQLNLDLDLHQVRNLDPSQGLLHDQDQPVPVVVNLVVAVLVNLAVAVEKVVLKVNK